MAVDNIDLPADKVSDSTQLRCTVCKEVFTLAEAQGQAPKGPVSLNLDDNKEKDTSVNNSPVADSDDNDSYDESLEAVEEFFDDDDNSSDMV